MIFLGLHRKPIKHLVQGLLCSRRPHAPSPWGEGAECLLERVLEAQAGKWTQRASVLQGISLKKRERKQDMGTKALMEQRCLIQHCVSIYTVLWGGYFQQRQNQNLQVIKETWSHPYERERVVNNHFYHMVHKKEENTYHHKEKLTKEMPGFLSPQERLASPLNSWGTENSWQIQNST